MLRESFTCQQSFWLFRVSVAEGKVTVGNETARMKPLEEGQVWRMAELNLQVGMVGKLLVHYKLAKPNAVRIPNSVGGISTIEKFLKKNKAVLVKA